MKVYFEDLNGSEIIDTSTRPDWVCPRKEEWVILFGKQYQVFRVTHDYGGGPGGENDKIVVTLC